MFSGAFSLQLELSNKNVAHAGLEVLVSRMHGSLNNLLNALDDS